MVAGLDGHEHGDAQSQLFRVEQSHPLLDYASGFQTPYPLPAGRERQPDPLCHLSDRQARIALKRIKNIDVDIIHRRSPDARHGLENNTWDSVFLSKSNSIMLFIKSQSLFDLQLNWSAVDAGLESPVIRNGS
jgi:hypothetical protein